MDSSMFLLWKGAAPGKPRKGRKEGKASNHRFIHPCAQISDYFHPSGNTGKLQDLFAFFFRKSINFKLVELLISNFFNQVNPPSILFSDGSIVNCFNVIIGDFIHFSFLCEQEYFSDIVSCDWPSVQLNDIEELFWKIFLWFLDLLQEGKKSFLWVVSLCGFVQKLVQPDICASGMEDHTFF